jgi:hypothetical protein
MIPSHRVSLSISTAAALLVAIPSPARADAAGDAVLVQVDAALNKAKTLVFDYEIVNQEAGKSERTMAMKSSTKGGKRLLEFAAPSDMKGTKVLFLSPTQTYVFLPAFGKVRRVASHTADQGFLGLAFSADDLGATSYGPSYTAKIGSDTAAEWKLVLTPKAGQQTSYAKIEMSVAKDKKVPTELKYFNADGKNVKTETRTGYSCEGDVCTPGDQKMTDNVKGAFTKLVAKSRKVNGEISDDVFTQRNLGELTRPAGRLRRYPPSPQHLLRHPPNHARSGHLAQRGHLFEQIPRRLPIPRQRDSHVHVPRLEQHPGPRRRQARPGRLVHQRPPRDLGADLGPIGPFFTTPSNQRAFLRARRFRREQLQQQLGPVVSIEPLRESLGRPRRRSHSMRAMEHHRVGPHRRIEQRLVHPPLVVVARLAPGERAQHPLVVTVGFDERGEVGGAHGRVAIEVDRQRENRLGIAMKLDHRDQQRSWAAEVTQRAGAMPRMRQ